MNLLLNPDVALRYKSGSQISRVITEDWVTRNMFCPICGAPTLCHYQANKPVADFFCENCKSDFELKSKENINANIGNIIPDGAYSTMIQRITSLNNPHLFALTHSNLTVNSLMLIPSYFFVPDIIEKRPPLKESARRAGWVGCNINIGKVPECGKIAIIRNGQLEDKDKVLELYKRTLSLNVAKIESRGWLFDVLRCVEKIPSTAFRLEDVYKFTDELQLKHPDNRFVHAKIRQQLQYLRDRGFLEFTTRGNYKKIK
ncbi:MAG: hypothetical protein IJS19_00715 [Muribaculaceae bacterium]|nr:hypothetical protein [Muribaculaceae bacterium]